MTSVAAEPVESDASVEQPLPVPPDQDDASFYPRFTEAQMRSIERFSVCTSFDAGEVLYEHGDLGAPLFILKSGSVRLVERDPCADRIFLSLRAPVFLGDISMFTGESTISACVAAEPVQALRVESDQLRQLVAEHSDVGDLLLGAMMARRAWHRSQRIGEMHLIGRRASRETFELRQFLERNQLPFEWSDPDTDAETALLLERMGTTREEEPVLIHGPYVCRRPKIREVAEELGLRPDLGSEPYDVVVVGAGPAGLAACVYAASEGLRTLALDGSSPGGQAGTSTKIENYLGFATGISGGDLTRQAVLQARKFGAVLSNLTDVKALNCGSGDDPLKTITLDDDRIVRARSVVIATGADYRKLSGEGFDRFHGNGTYYAAGHPEAMLCRERDVIVVGGGNSAGQAAIFLSQHARKVYIVIRGDDLGRSMSQYLVSRIEKAENIELLTHTQVTALHGNGSMESATLSGPDGEREVPAVAVFVMIGALPRTDWLATGDCVGLCPKGFIATGQHARDHDRFASHWSADREPFYLETTRPGILAVGDVRSGSIKRVASAVGEGSMAVKYVHEVLAASLH